MKKLFLLFAFVSLITQYASSQETPFMVQGHLRPDAKSALIKNTTPKQISTSFSFDNIEFWVGEGSKKAALVIDWFDGKGGTLVWGYRFEGEATGYDMVTAVAKADPRFIFLTHSTNLGNTIAGLGYDLNRSGNLSLSLKGTEYTPTDGTVTTTEYNYDDWTCSDTFDHWVSGWYSGYWSYQVKDNIADEFSYSGLGASSRILTDGSVDGWGFQSFSNPSQEGVIPRYPYTDASYCLPNFEAYWSEINKDSKHMSIIPNSTARFSDEFTEKWKVEMTSGWSSGGQPIIVNNNIYLAINSVVRKMNAETGDVLKETALVGNCGFFSMIAYGDGKIFVPLSNGVLQAFNADTLEPLWQTTPVTGFQQLCPVTYSDGYVYTGMWKGGRPAQGTYYCVSSMDENPQSPNEIKEYTWQSENTGYYWSGGTVIGDCILFGGDSGILESRNRITGALVDSFQLDNTLSTSTIRSGTSYDAASGRLFFTGKETHKVYSIKIDNKGNIEKESILSGELSGEATTTPTLYNNRLYVTSGTMSSGGGLDVLDANTLERIYSVNLGGISQSTPLISTGYATPENGYCAYIYVCLNNASGAIVCVKDFEGNDTPIVQFTYTPSSTQYSTHSLVADQDGTIYYKNDAKYLFALTSSPSADINVATVSIDDNSGKVDINGTLKLSATIAPMNATNTIVDWSSDNEALATVDTKGNVTGVAAGNVTITATSRDGKIAANTLIKVIDTATGIDEIKDTKMSVYPNPFSQYLIVNSTQESTLSIVNLSGSVVVSKQVSAGENHIDTSSLPSGVYILKCNGIIKKLIK